MDNEAKAWVEEVVARAIIGAAEEAFQEAHQGVALMGPELCGESISRYARAIEFRRMAYCLMRRHIESRTLGKL